MIYLTWEDIDARLERLNLAGVRVWGIPRGGAIVAGLARRFGAIPVDNPAEAQVALEDIIDSGSTAREVLEKHGLSSLALVNKLEEGIDQWVHFPWEGDSRLDIAGSVRRIIEHLGEDPNREGLRDTPVRVVESWSKLYQGYQIEPSALLRWFEDDTDEMIICKDIQFYSTCEHHMLPFFGKVGVAYIPCGKVIGISKLARVVDAFARRLQIQERLTRQIGGLLEPHVAGVAVHVEARHLCMMARGVSQQESVLVTNYLTGPFRDKPEARSEFLAAIR
ncbi:MAG: GTP cyclohydrolase I FolE [Dehalococcoidia bacterium]